MVYSIIYHLESNDFSRLRIGIGNDFEKGNLTDYVFLILTKMIS
jgi:peptidyl-tRNA hydrolase